MHAPLAVSSNIRRIRVTRGFDVPLAGAPSREVADAGWGGPVAVSPATVRGIKARSMVAVGDVVRRGTPVVYDKRDPSLRLCSPASGTVRTIEFGARRVLARIVIEPDGRDDAVPVLPPSARGVTMTAEQILEALKSTGLLTLIRQRPFSRLPDFSAKPKALFVNAMSTAPFQADADIAVRIEPDSFAAGLDALRRVTPGPVHLVLPDRPGLCSALTEAAGVEISQFSGPHPSGNTSVHIHHLAPIRPGECVWTVRAVDVALIGRMLLTGEAPGWRIVALGGPGTKDGAARHYRTPWGVSLQWLTRDRLRDGELRRIAGDALSGAAIPADGFVPLETSSVTVLPEDRSRHLLAWADPLAPGFSLSRTFLSAWRRAGPEPMGTNLHGAVRAMVGTGLYDRYLPMRVRLDYLIRAVLANDWEEAVQLGLLELDPEDVALPAFACPSKMDLVGILREGLAAAEREGF